MGGGGFGVLSTVLFVYMGKPWVYGGTPMLLKVWLVYVCVGMEGCVISWL